MNSSPKKVVAPGRVNLIGDHTDYTGGLVLPMAINRFTTLSFAEQEARVTLSSDAEAGEVDFALGGGDAETLVNNLPRWGRYVAAVASLMPDARGVHGGLTTDIPVGAGLSSSAALEIAVGLALGFNGTALELAQMAQRAEHLAVGVPCGIMDQLCIASAKAGHATLINCSSFEVEHISMPSDVKIVVRFIAQRTLAGSHYATRVSECAVAEQSIGSLAVASLRDVGNIQDNTIKARAAHVVSENARVRSFAGAMVTGDYALAGEIMCESHRSLAENYEVSTRQMDSAVDEMRTTPGVYGARMTGGGFGGCIVALCEPEAEVDGWVVQPVGAAHLQ